MSWQRVVLLAVVAGALVGAGMAQDRSLPAPTKVAPRFEVVAETRLLMEGLAQPNYESLLRHLRERPGDAETWAFARGQALLIAETGNLLMLRPPRNAGRDAWMQRSMELRQAAAMLARSLGARDLESSRAALVNVAGACNRCHQTFRVSTRIGPGAPKGKDSGAERDAE